MFIGGIGIFPSEGRGVNRAEDRTDDQVSEDVKNTDDIGHDLDHIADGLVGDVDPGIFVGLLQQQEELLRVLCGHQGDLRSGVQGGDDTDVEEHQESEQEAFARGECPAVELVAVTPHEVHGEEYQGEQAQQPGDRSQHGHVAQQRDKRQGKARGYSVVKGVLADRHSFFHFGRVYMGWMISGLQDVVGVFLGKDRPEDKTQDRPNE